jgi:hypothetical protein
MVQGQDHHNIEEEWYMAASHETSLMELSYPSPYGTAPDTPRSSFNVNMLDSPLSFDNTNTLLTNFRTAPALGMGMESNRILDELAGNNAGGQGLLSSISSGKFVMQCNAMQFHSHFHFYMSSSSMVMFHTIHFFPVKASNSRRMCALLGHAGHFCRLFCTSMQCNTVQVLHVIKNVDDVAYHISPVNASNLRRICDLFGLCHFFRSLCNVAPFNFCMSATMLMARTSPVNVRVA